MAQACLKICHFRGRQGGAKLLFSISKYGGSVAHYDPVEVPRQDGSNRCRIGISIVDCLLKGACHPGVMPSPHRGEAKQAPLPDALASSEIHYQVRQ